jgi:hypothetical protein
MHEFRKLVFKQHRFGKVGSLMLFTIQKNEVFSYTTRIFYNNYVSRLEIITSNYSVSCTC